MKKNAEIITVREALTRLHLEGLIPDGGRADWLVEWSGYPKPFACGHDRVRGFGPLHEDKPNDQYGSARWYQEKCRVNQFLCSGAVLFSFPCVSDSKQYYLDSTFCIVIDHPPDVQIDTVLKAVFSG